MTDFITRFAPSPTGPLHLGHAYSAFLAHDMAIANGGVFLLRIDDLDQSRSRPKWEEQIKEDLCWLGLWWPEPCRRESEHHDAYERALDKLWDLGLLYPCHCTRRDIKDALSAPQETTPVEGPDGLVYPGTCSGNMSFERTFPEDHPRPKNVTLRLDMKLAVSISDLFQHRVESKNVDWKHYASFVEEGCGPAGQTGLVEFTPEDMITGIGDVVLSRKDSGAAYHLAVAVDDAAQDVTHVVRGQDLFEATKIHVLLQNLLALPTPIYHHHRLIRDENGKRLAKRDDARAISTYRAEGKTPRDIRRMVGL